MKKISTATVVHSIFASLLGAPQHVIDESGIGVTVVGGISYPDPRRHGVHDFVTWPLGRATVTEDGVRLALRGVLERVIDPVLIPYEEIEVVEKVRTASRVIESLRFRSASRSLDRHQFATWREGTAVLLGALEWQDVPVREIPWRETFRSEWLGDR